MRVKMGWMVGRQAQTRATWSSARDQMLPGSKTSGAGLAYGKFMRSRRTRSLQRSV